MSASTPHSQLAYERRNNGLVRHQPTEPPHQIGIPTISTPLRRRIHT